MMIHSVLVSFLSHYDDDDDVLWSEVHMLSFSLFSSRPDNCF